MRFAPLISRERRLVDVACGSGRHIRALHRLGHSGVALDRDVRGVQDLIGTPGIAVLRHDLEVPTGTARPESPEHNPWPFAGELFSGIVVTNYLHRPLLPTLVAAVAPGGFLLYETFAVGNEHFGRPSDPSYLLQPGELLDAVAGELHVVAYEHGEIALPRPAVVQRLAAARPTRQGLAARSSWPLPPHL